MAGFIKIALGMEVNLSPDNFVLDGDPAPSPKTAELIKMLFGLGLGWAQGSIY